MKSASARCVAPNVSKTEDASGSRTSTTSAAELGDGAHGRVEDCGDVGRERDLVQVGADTDPEPAEARGARRVDISDGHVLRRGIARVVAGDRR